VRRIGEVIEVEGQFDFVGDPAEGGNPREHAVVLDERLNVALDDLGQFKAREWFVGH
jgi:hypothetical protein